MVTDVVSKPIHALRIEQRKYYTNIYLGATLLYAIHHVAQEYADSGEPLEDVAEFHIINSGIVAMLLPKTKRDFDTHKTAIEACISALRDFRADLCQLDL